jgi:two-component system sensor histidine kinase KdpD
MRPLNFLGLHTISKTLQSAISVVSILTVAGLCFYTVNYLGYHVTALILLLLVSVLAMLFDIIPVLIAAFLSAVVWNFFFIPPIYTFHIARSEDAFLFMMYFVVALVNATLTYKIRASEKKLRLREEKENSIKLYNTLLNSLSHELKTPVSTIIMAVDTLKENKGHLSEEGENELLGQIGTASFRLNKEVENLLSMSRLESGVLQLHYDWTDLNDLISLVLNKIEDQEGNHSIVVEANENLPLVKLDSLLIQNALFNLIHNAIQYTAEGTSIFVRMYMEDDTCVINIADNGAGIPLKEQVKVFDMFYRMPHTKAGGTGLGLSIVKGFVEAHQGKLELVSAEGKGASFFIRLNLEFSYLNKLKHE